MYLYEKNGYTQSMRYDVVIFDWDGTLWDSWQTHQDALRHIADKLGCVNPRPEAVASCLGLPLDEILGALFESNPAPLLDWYLGHYERRWRATSRLFPGVVQMLHGLRGKGYQLALFSNKTRSAATQELAAAGLSGSFVVKTFGDEVTRAKPAPDGVHHVLQSLQAEPSRSLYVGDTATDMHCAADAGVGFAAALWGSRDPEALASAAPSLAWRKPQDALAQL